MNSIIMKFLPTLNKPHLLRNKSYTFIFSFTIPIVLTLVFILFSFTSPELPKSTLMIPFSGDTDEEVISTIFYKVSDMEMVDAKVEEAFVSKMEQTKGIFSKHLNMSVVDNKGNLVALVLTDVKNGSIGTSLNQGIYFGVEHQKANQNFSIDLGTVVFSNSSNLILEKNDGTSTLSRNGWIQIEKCKNGMISGKFEFEVVGEKSNSQGTFENVNYTVTE